MSLQVENLEHNMAKVTIEVEAAKLDNAIKQAFNKKKGQFNVPGFRKGKVPFQLIAKEYGVEIFYEDAANILIPDAYAEAMKDTDNRLLTQTNAKTATRIRKPDKKDNNIDANTSASADTASAANNALADKK